MSWSEEWPKLRDELVAATLQQAAEEAMRIYVERWSSDRSVYMSITSGSAFFGYTPESQFTRRAMTWRLTAALWDHTATRRTYEDNIDRWWTAKKLRATLDGLNNAMRIDRNNRLIDMMTDGGEL